MNINKLVKEKILPLKANFYAKQIHANLLLNNTISRCAVAASLRKVNPSSPSTWEFSGFSQNGEDGIIEHLLSGLKNSNRYFIEIGSGNGLENNTGYLAHIKKFAGLQVEGNGDAYAESLVIKPWLTEIMNCFVNENTVKAILDKALFKNPDVFSIDIDGMDYYIAKMLLENGLRPKVVIVEYNSAFGPDKSITIPYNENFNMFATPYTYLYYGVSVACWKNLFKHYGYEFVTVETNGVNAFFIKQDEFVSDYLNGVQKIEFKENMHQMRLFKKNWEGQFDMIKNLTFEAI